MQTRKEFWKEFVTVMTVVSLFAILLMVASRAWAYEDLSGSSYSQTPDGTFVQGSGYTQTPNGGFVSKSNDFTMFDHK